MKSQEYYTAKQKLTLQYKLYKLAKEQALKEYEEKLIALRKDFKLDELKSKVDELK